MQFQTTLTPDGKLRECDNLINKKNNLKINNSTEKLKRVKTFDKVFILERFKNNILYTYINLPVFKTFQFILL